MKPEVPVVVFAYSRPDRLGKLLECLKADEIPLLYVFSDGPADGRCVSQVEKVRDMLRRIDWCDCRIVERSENLGLGKSILSGVNAVFKKHDRLIVFEDDLVCVRGTYRYMCRALEAYENDRKVMSISGWTNPRIRPPVPGDKAYFDGRFACLGWGTWRGAWEGMDIPARSLIRRCRLMFKDVNRYGADIPEMALHEEERNIWAVRFCLLHILKKGLCFHPPRSLVKHCGFGEGASNAIDGRKWGEENLWPEPEIPSEWPEPKENPDVHILWQKLNGYEDGDLEKMLKLFGLRGGNIFRNRHSVWNRIRRRMFRALTCRDKRVGKGGGKGQKRLWGYAMNMEYPDEALWREQFCSLFCEDCAGVHGLPSEPRIVDCNANIGTFALFVKWARPGADIVCVESLMENCEYLKLNTSQFEDDSISIVVPSESWSLNKALQQKTDLLKLDIEGAELEALEEAGDGLDNVDRVVVECHDYRGRPAPIPGMVKLLYDHGLTTIRIDSHRRIAGDDGAMPVRCCLLHAWRPVC